MLRLGKKHVVLNVINDEIGIPTYVADLAKAVFVNNKINCEVYPITTDQYPTAVKRPHFCLLNKNKLKETFKIEIPYWNKSLIGCLELIDPK